MAKAETAPAVAAPPPFAEQLMDERTTQAMAKEEYRKAVAKKVGRYKVECGGEERTFDARDDNEAWALFCDSLKTWPSRRYVKPVITKVA